MMHIRVISSMCALENIVMGCVLKFNQSNFESLENFKGNQVSDLLTLRYSLNYD